jgi:hypothetical protein
VISHQNTHKTLSFARESVFIGGVGVYPYTLFLSFFHLSILDPRHHQCSAITRLDLYRQLSLPFHSSTPSLRKSKVVPPPQSYGDLHLAFSLLRAAIPLQRKLARNGGRASQEKIKRPDGHRDKENMNYLKQVDAWLDAELGALISTVQQAGTDKEATEAFNDTKRAIKEKILESYRNGQEHGKKREGSAVRKIAGAVTKEAVRQVSYQSSKPRQKRQAVWKK